MQASLSLAADVRDRAPEKKGVARRKGMRPTVDTLETNIQRKTSWASCKSPFDNACLSTRKVWMKVCSTNLPERGMQ